MPRFLRLILTTVVAMSTLSVAAQTPKSYDIGNLGKLSLTFPETWQDHVARAPDSNGTTIAFTAKAGPKFQIFVTAGLEISDTESKAPSEIARSVAAEAVAVVAPQAVEKDIAINEFKGDGMIAYYFTVTDKAPKPDEFKYLSQGTVVTGRMLTTFTILTNDDSRSADSSAINMIKTLSFEPSERPATKERPKRSRRLEPGET